MEDETADSTSNNGEPAEKGGWGRPAGAPSDFPDDISESTTPGSSSSPRKRDVMLRWMTFSLTLFWIFAIILRVSVRDRLSVLAVMFYATPPAVLTGLALLISGLLCLRKSRRRALGVFLLGIICGVYWWQTSFFHHDAVVAEDSFRVLLWNCQGGRHGWENVTNQIRDIDAPLVGLVEATTHTKKRKRFWRNAFPDAHVAMPGGHIALISRDEILSSQLIPLGNGSRCGQFEVEIGRRQLTVLVIDIQSNPFVSRRLAFENLLKLIDSYGDQPLLLMGDFNTPTDSYLFERLRLRCQNAFETAGNGNSATWPLPLPVLPLDQVWTHDLPRAVSCQHVWTTSSDHRPVVTDMTFLQVNPQ